MHLLEYHAFPDKEGFWYDAAKKKYCEIVEIVINQLQALFPPNEFISIEMRLC